MPDIDIDFDDLRRGEVIEYVKRKYGEDNVTQIITFGTMGAKGVVRDVGRALGLAFAEVDRIAKHGARRARHDARARARAVARPQEPARSAGPPYARLLHSARVLEGLARHASTHAAGVLITPGPLLDYVPLYRQKDESITTQWDMKSVEKAGLLKMDFLGLRTLSVLDEAVRLVAQHRRGRRSTSPRCPIDDAAAYQRVPGGRDGRRSSSSSRAGMRDYLQRLKPTVFGDLVAMNALYRPGPMENIPYFIDCKHGRAGRALRPSRPRADPERHLRRVRLPGAGDGRRRTRSPASRWRKRDELRRAMGKKRPEEMEAKRAAVHRGLQAQRKIPHAEGGEDLRRPWRSSPATASTARTPPPTRCSPISAPISRPTIPPSSWPRR